VNSALNRTVTAREPDLLLPSVNVVDHQHFKVELPNANHICEEQERTPQLISDL
jgi:hypothetical protein